MFMKNTVLARMKVLIALIPISLVVNSCANSDIKTAQKFGEVSDQLGQLNAEVAKDIYESCARSSVWLARGTSGTRQNMRSALQNCDEIFRPNSVNTEIAGNLLIEYVRAIGTLATEDRETVGTRFEDIGKALKEIKIETGGSEAEPSVFQLQPDTVETGVRIATFITNFILSDFRRRNLKTAIVCTDPAIQSYSSDLAHFINEFYIKNLLDDEINSVTRYFAGYRSPLTDTTNLLLDSGSPEVFTSLQDTQLNRDQALRAEISKIIDKKNIGATYVTLVQTTAAAHADLKRIFNDGEDEISPELSTRCNEYFNEEASNAETSRTLERDFMNQQISQSELKQVREVAEAYIEQVKLLIEDANKPEH